MRRRVSSVSPHGATDSGAGNGAIACYLLMVLIFAVALGFIDRQIFVLVVEPVKRDLNLSDL